MLKTIDALINRVTMYRLVVYELIFLLCAACVLGLFGVLAYSPVYLIYSAAFLFAVCWCVNGIFAWAFDAPYNPESTWITALILALIITPPEAVFDLNYLPLALWAGAIAVASKYILAIRGQHIFNPAAFGVATTALWLGFSASWWVGTMWMAPFVLLAGLLIVRKLHRFDLWWAFMAVFVLGTSGQALLAGHDLLTRLSQSLLYAPAFFFATVMLTEPMTMPPTRWLRITFGTLVGFLFLPNVNLGGFYFTPELALLVGNLFAFAVSPKQKLVLALTSTVKLSQDAYELSFASKRRLRFKPGQYAEWTLSHEGADSKGVRRYFTLSSSPTESDLKLGLKMYERPSSFKRSLIALKPGDTIVVSQLAGDFTLPKDKDRKLAFIAGGIGVTPFRSMVKYLLDKRERRDAVLFYANKVIAEAVYTDIFDEAERELGLKVVHGALFSAEAIAKEIPDYRERLFYISGPQSMVTSYKDQLLYMGVNRTHIKTDYFSGL